MMPHFSQSDYERRFEWGPSGVAALAQPETFVVIVDVLRFTTTVEAAVSRGAIVYPYEWNDASAREFAESLDAQIADGSYPNGPSLSPTNLLRQVTLESIVVPSPNGSTCAVLAAKSGATVVAACLRNAPAVANYLRESSLPVSVIACGERWPDGSLRPALEDLIGAGALLSALGGRMSPEALAAVAAWQGSNHDVEGTLRECSSGRELLERGRFDDLEYAGQVGVSVFVPVLVNGAFRSGR
jgi:2-phosphosulfolactate phosphatase